MDLGCYKRNLAQKWKTTTGSDLADELVGVGLVAGLGEGAAGQLVEPRLAAHELVHLPRLREAVCGNESQWQMATYKPWHFEGWWKVLNGKK